MRTGREPRFTLAAAFGPRPTDKRNDSVVARGLLWPSRMHPRRRNPVKAALLAFPVFYLGGIALSLHGGPCTVACHPTFFWPTALGGPLVVGFLAAALPRFALEDRRREDGAAMELDAEQLS